MDKKGHIYISKLITNILEENEIFLARNYRFVTTVGNIFPDIRPSFLRIKHTKETTFNYVESKMIYITNYAEKINRIFLFRLGEIIHYICDYFIYPHNPTIWNGSLLSHIKYEQTQHKYEFRYIQQKKYLKDSVEFKINKDSNINEVFNQIEHYHNLYLKEIPNMYTDCKYITCMILGLVQWFFYQIFNIEIKLA